MRQKYLLAVFVVAATISASGQVSPEVHNDGRVTFRLRAPEAKTVRVRCEGLKEAGLEKDDQGVWSFTSDPIEPDIYS